MEIIVLGGYIMYMIVMAVIVFSVKSCNDARNKEKYDNRLDELRASGYKVTYSNRTTGTIGYRAYGKYYSESVFRGYNSKHRG